MLAALIPAVTELASGYLANRKEKAVAKQKLAVAKIEAQVTKAGLIGQPLLHQLPHPWTGKVESDRLPFPDPRPPHPLDQFSEGVGVLKLLRAVPKPPCDQGIDVLVMQVDQV